MPALRQEGGELLVPERKSDKWIRTDPELLIGDAHDRRVEVGHEVAYRDENSTLHR